jgi:voltage-gated potassium channel
MNSLDRVETFMQSHKIPTELKSKVRNYYHYLWTNHRDYQDRSLLEDLPVKVQSELYLFINKAIISKVSFLKGAETELIEDLMHELRPQIYVPGEKIFKVDEPGHALYFIQRGQVEILSREGKLIAHLDDGACFGEMALISDRARSANARAVSYCDVYVLEKESFYRVAKSYPQLLTHIQKIMSDRQQAA